jgi:hypothetical protein
VVFVDKSCFPGKIVGVFKVLSGLLGCRRCVEIFVESDGNTYAKIQVQYIQKQEFGRCMLQSLVTNTPATVIMEMLIQQNCWLVLSCIASRGCGMQCGILARITMI